MRVAFVTPRYGTEVLGGAEHACRMLAEHVAARPGWSTEALTTCAIDLVTWANHYPAGAVRLNGVDVRRFSNAAERHDRFGDITAALLANAEHVPLAEQERWLEQQGPYSPSLVDAIASCAADVVVFYPYLYHPMYWGIRSGPASRATVLHPAAHDEPLLRLPMYGSVFGAAGAFVFQTEAERRLVEERFPVTAARPQILLGLGVEAEAGDTGGFRNAFGLADDPYLVCVGRVDDVKGTTALARFFGAYKARRIGPLKLVLVGPVAHRPPEHDDIIVTGPLDESFKWGALRGAVALVSPSPFEAFSLVLMEGWSAGVPVVVNAQCEATVEHARRAAGGLAFAGYAEFEAVVDRLVSDPRLRGALARNGSAYVETNFTWPAVIDRYCRFLERVQGLT